MKAHGIRRVMKFVMFAVLAGGIFGFVVMWLWNHLMPALFGLHSLGFWQALGLLILSKILLSGFHGRPGFSRDWRMRFIRRWDQMTPEEREAFRTGLREGCRPSGPSPAAPKA
jgi:Ca2+/H+ antiporter, TMEM165/GDT1 family